ncbi:germacrene A synthase-like isoform X1 [Salvia hispanica]|uniref:germacrene A synthase-like isoform X1 n=1 Tax=Salvia hispanica TaxID=49212 RepID=UPI002009B6DE|nr:germacrene A synthase-like isoform X1 [Salvia hispanica]
MAAHRPEYNFPPSLWGDQFINYISDSKVLEKYSNSVEVMKNEVRNLLTAPQTKMIDTMNLINTLERLGVSYHFENEIEEKLQQFFHLNTNYDDDEVYDLYTVALHFRLFRQHGHRISTAEIFAKWMDEKGNFKESIKSDTKGLLSLYEASYLRTRGEAILEDALAFTTATLKSMVPNLGSPLKKQVERALMQPLHFGTPRIEARSYIAVYEEEEHKNETLIKFAKSDYNLLQMQHKEELQQVSRWWRELGLMSKLPYTRDRMVECFFWAMAMHPEPQYSRARATLAKSIAIASVLDDTYDAYGTIEELEVFTKAIERWDYGEISQLPEYMRPIYKAILELYNPYEEELAKEGRSYASYYAIERLKELARGYFEEAKWLLEGNLPSFEEYLKLGQITSTYDYLVPASFMGIGSTRKEDFEWLSEKPKILVSTLIIGRLLDDIGSYEFETKRGQLAIGIESYMKDNDVTKEEAMAKFMELCTNAWIDNNEEMLRPSCYKSRDLLMHILNLNRVTYVAYKDKEDGYTQPEKVLKPHIVGMLVDAFDV